MSEGASVRFQYETLYIDSGSPTSESQILKDMGKDGWELVSVVQQYSWRRAMYFKRGVSANERG